MSSLTLPYGSSTQSFSLPDNLRVDWIVPSDIQPAPDPIQEVCHALDHPTGDISLENFRGARSAAIAINDKTRPVPHEILLPPLLERLKSLGVPPENTRLIIATGTHTPVPPEEYGRVVPPEILSQYPVSSHDCDAPDLALLGTTSRGTPVWANRFFIEADIRIVVGNIEPHHFMGFSGGVKSASIGLAGRDTINRNHAMLTDPFARTAEYLQNPMRQDVEEIGQIFGVHFALNALLNLNKGIVRVLAGDPRAVMLAGIPLVRSICQVETIGDYDLVIASPGGHPKDINFYQAQKGLTHAALLCKDGGTVILAAACPEGVGSAGYFSFVEGLQSQSEVMERFTQEGFRVGPHKAYQVARIARRVNVVLCSEMPEEVVVRLLLKPAQSVANALEYLVASLQTGSRVAVLPRAVATVPTQIST